MFNRRFTGHTASRAAKKCPKCRGFLPGSDFILIPASLCTCDRCVHNIRQELREPSVCEECVDLPKCGMCGKRLTPAETVLDSNTDKNTPRPAEGTVVDDEPWCDACHATIKENEHE